MTSLDGSLARRRKLEVVAGALGVASSLFVTLTRGRTRWETEFELIQRNLDIEWHAGRTAFDECVRDDPCWADAPRERASEPVQRFQAS
ncbi:hypothetical protein MRB53_038619 [Persea americana]|nr:hypothetical protein MRB53_038619 [Persea americana]